MKLLAALLSAVPALAHVVSMSTGEARIDGPRLTYELRMPAYEVAHVQHPETALLGAIRFRSRGAEGRQTARSCHGEAGTYVCQAAYDFPDPIDVLEVECRYPSVTVPNHVHMLRAVRDGRWDQAAFDASFTTAELRFRPPTAFETAIRDLGAGFWRSAAGPAQMLFLLALCLAARGQREMTELFAMFAAGQVAACVTARAFGVWLSPRFLEAAAALTIAYLAVEILALPGARGRWAVAGALGVVHGLYFAMILAAGDWNRWRFFTGVICGEAVVAAALWLGSRAIARFTPARRVRWEPGFASVLLAIGLGWFVLRLRS